MGLTKATLQNVSLPGQRTIDVMFNPTEYSVTTNMNYAEIPVPGLRMPLIQFVRGETRVLSVELFLDNSDKGTSLKEDLQKLREFVTIDSGLHAPPVCRFKWGDLDQFDGVVSAFNEKFVLFDENGNVLRARVTLSLKSYRPAELQYQDLNRQSPDRTKTRVVQEGERLDWIASEEYGDASFWTVLANANKIARPRLLQPGTLLRIPPL